MRTHKRVTSNKSTKNNKKRTYKIKYPSEIHGNIIKQKEGWIVLQIYGEPFQRGYAHGHFLRREIHKTKKVFQFFVKYKLQIPMEKYMNVVRTRIIPNIRKQFPEIYQEMLGIAKGARVSSDFIVAWNAYLSLSSYFQCKQPLLRCSAFIATGNATKNGDIVMAHTTHTNYADGQLCNIVLYVSPNQGHAFVMQTQPGLVASGTDWFQCSNGIIGCETTIGAAKYRTQLIDLYFCRVRKAMQYATHLDDYENIMTTNNGGDYACSWLFGDTNTGEIMLLELGQKTNNIKRTKNGTFYGMNTPLGSNLREFADINELKDIETSSGARHQRFQELLHEKYENKIDIENAKAIITDTYDVFSKETQSSKRTIYKYTDEFKGSTDAKVCNTECAKQLAFWGKFGIPDDTDFSVKDCIERHPEYKEWSAVVDDFPKYKWVQIQR